MSESLVDPALLSNFRQQLDTLRERHVILFGGKGGVGKTTVSALAALHFSHSRGVVLFTSDPASNLDDLFMSAPNRVTVEKLDARALYDEFLQQNLANILELADRGTLLDKEEARRFFELALPGVDELMAWLHIGDLATQHPDALLIVDTAPTGHTLRMLRSSEHFRQFVAALQSMQQKHKDLIEQFARRRVHDALDDFLSAFDERQRRVAELLTDPRSGAFVPVALAEPWVLAQTERLVRELRGTGGDSDAMDVPFVVLNRVPPASCQCARCRERRARRGNDIAGVSVVELPDACSAIDSEAKLGAFLNGTLHREVRPERPPADATRPLSIPQAARLVFFAGKGGVGKTTTASAVALASAAASPEKQFVVISVDPAHTLRDVFAGATPPPNLRVEIIDTRERWRRFRATLGEEITNAFDALTPRGISLGSDARVMQQLIDVAPPGADELFAVMRLADLAADDSVARVFIDTAPTGHFLRLLELPRSAGEWVREFMRLLLRYRELIPPCSLAEELLEASRALRAFEELLHSERAGAILVTRPERLVVRETERLRDELAQQNVQVLATVVNYVTPQSPCSCDQSRRRDELETLATLNDVTEIERRDSPPTSLDDLRALIPMLHTPSNG